MEAVLTKAKLVNRYLDAKDFLIHRGFADEIDWQDATVDSDFCESDFLREGAWVILSSGMREAVIARVFPAIGRAFRDWRSATEIVEAEQEVFGAAFQLFGHRAKVNAMLALAGEVSASGFDSVKHRVKSEGADYLHTFAFIGPVTSLHLAKNLGVDIAKPDRHLVRIAKTAGYLDAQVLCETISDVTGDRVSVVDIVWWRFATLVPRYLDWLLDLDSKTMAPIFDLDPENVTVSA
ncbi:MAG: hypothetical protein GKR94_17295 [Gammaproteobacteria bacterium]|nr:hypothetical protein [Gammaproteobacteria bacterium]